jgi:hypothetical protein
MRLPGLYENIPNETYHADKEWLSSSQIKIAKGSAHAFKYFVLDDVAAKKKPSTALNFGSIVHKLVLENDDFYNEYFIGDTSDMDMRTKAGKDAYAALSQLAGDRTLVSKEEFARAVKCYDSVMAHPDANRLLSLAGLSESSIYVELDHALPSGEIVPFKVRVRPDRLAHGHAIIDLKTTKDASIESFTKDALAPWGYGYDISAALYQRAVAKLTGELLPFIFIAVHSDQPYGCAVYELGEESTVRANARLDRCINTIILSERAGKWVFQNEMESI